MIKSFLNLCLLLFLDLLAHMVAIAAAFAVAWAALCGAQWIFGRFLATITALKAHLRKKEMHAHATR